MKVGHSITKVTASSVSVQRHREWMLSLVVLPTRMSVVSAVSIFMVLQIKSGKDTFGKIMMVRAVIVYEYRQKEK